MTDFIHVTNRIKRPTMQKYTRAGIFGGWGPAPQRDVDFFEPPANNLQRPNLDDIPGINLDLPREAQPRQHLVPDEKYIALHTITSFWRHNTYGWCVKTLNDEYVVHESSSPAIVALLTQANNLKDGLLLSKVDAIVQKLDLLVTSLELLPDIGVKVCEIKREFEEHLKDIQ